jgi:hypothetical protein
MIIIIKHKNSIIIKNEKIHKEKKNLALESFTVFQLYIFQALFIYKSLHYIFLKHMDNVHNHFSLELSRRLPRRLQSRPRRTKV